VVKHAYVCSMLNLGSVMSPVACLLCALPQSTRLLTHHSAISNTHCAWHCLPNPAKGWCPAARARCTVDM
jgi:hypothetical protein